MASSILLQYNYLWRDEFSSSDDVKWLFPTDDDDYVEHLRISNLDEMELLFAITSELLSTEFVELLSEDFSYETE